MGYKDKDKQREANRLAQAKFKAKAKGITKQGITLPEQTDLGNTLTTTQTAGITTQLPACVPSPVRDRYIKGELEYVQTIDRLLAHTLDELTAKNIWIPAWRHYAGQEIERAA